MSNAKKVFVPFNINDEVRVKLTVRGREVHRQNWQERCRAYGRTVAQLPYRPPEEDREGWSRWQLWGLMSEFGEHLSPVVPMPFDNAIEFVQYVRDEPEPQSALVG